MHRPPARPLTVERTHVELYLRWFERQVGSINTVSHGISVLASFYRWLVQTGQTDTPPSLRSVAPHAPRVASREVVYGAGLLATE